LLFIPLIFCYCHLRSWKVFPRPRYHAMRCASAGICPPKGGGMRVPYYLVDLAWTTTNPYLGTLSNNNHPRGSIFLRIKRRPSPPPRSWDSQLGTWGLLITLHLFWELPLIRNSWRQKFLYFSVTLVVLPCAVGNNCSFTLVEHLSNSLGSNTSFEWYSIIKYIIPLLKQIPHVFIFPTSWISPRYSLNQIIVTFWFASDLRSLIASIKPKVMYQIR